MPVQLNYDATGWFFQYGNSGKKYRIRANGSLTDLQKAYEKAMRQQRAVHARNRGNI